LPGDRSPKLAFSNAFRWPSTSIAGVPNMTTAAALNRTSKWPREAKLSLARCLRQ
jgi:hypothetical protein